MLYTSKELDEMWGLGHCYIGQATFESAAYVARYCLKKVTGKDALHYYNEIDPKTGEIISETLPEYVTMSKNPAIGLDWYEQFKDDCFPNDSITTRGIKVKPPKYYLSKLELTDPDLYAKVKSQRKAAAFKNQTNRDRLDAAEIIKHQTVQTCLTRDLEKENTL